ncbi:MAG TPA: phosphatase PAP2 family protein [Bacteroidales bacterium]|nr:phosphatase PAP2 family protein [Bacteroidales bacterium]
MNKKVARLVSLLGHPFLTIPLYTLIITFNIYDIRKALFVSAIILVGFFVPLIVWNLVRTKKGIYTNFDVSNQQQRNSMYLFALPLLAGVLIIFHFTNQETALQTNILFGIILLFTSYIVNFFIKCSGHMSLTIFLSFIILPVNFIAAICLLVCAIVIGWSRLELKRHTFTEVMAGMFLGLITGLTMLYCQGYIKLV